MIGLLRSDFYKLRKMKAFWVCIASLTGIALASVAMNYYYYSTQPALTVELPQAYATLMEGFDGTVAIFVAVVASMFAACEFGFGTIKNSASRGFSREKVYLSKLITSIAASFACMFTFIVVNTLSTTVIWGFGTPPAGFWPEFFTALGLELLLTAALSASFVLVATFLRQSGGAIALNLCIIQFSQLGTMLMEMAVEKLFGVKIAFSEWLISTTMMDVVQSPGPSMTIRALCVAAGFLIGCTALGIFLFRKRDIK